MNELVRNDERSDGEKIWVPPNPNATIPSMEAVRKGAPTRKEVVRKGRDTL